ncbi:MAG: TetR/AcrR family transcriptional regulator [Bacteroidetes bacterium]|nr:MAG: TetR/AcrR family transcriptional regulator [Bacteroidota bacterium]
MKDPKETKSYLSIMQNARSLFWKHGIRRVTVEEICREAGVSKMTFYRFFNNKNEAVEKVLDGVLEESHLRYESIMQQEIPFAEKMKQVILLKQDTITGISEEFIRDIYQQDQPGLMRRMEDYRKQVIEEVMEDFRMAQANGWIRKDMKLGFITYILDHLTSMIQDEKLISLYPNSQDAIMEVTNFFFYGILSGNNPGT